MNRLRQATGAQDAAIALVEATPGARAESFWLRNTLVVYGGAGLATAIAKLPGVKVVRAERIYPLVKPVETQAAVLAARRPEWGVEKIGADDVWADGVIGRASSSANVDTGVQFTTRHSSNQYRGNLGGGTFDHDYNWWDPTGICGDEPCDNAGHGTHTMGTMVGGDGPGPFTPDIGVAPGATWIAAKGCEDFGCSDVALLSVRPVHPRSDRPRREQPGPVEAPGHRQQLVGRRARRPVLSRRRQGLARGRDHPGLLGRQRRPVLRQRRLARRLPRVLLRRRDRHRRRHRRLLVARPIGLRQGQSRRVGAPASRPLVASPAAATPSSTGPRWRPRTPPGTLALMLSAELGPDRRLRAAQPRPSATPRSITSTTSAAAPRTATRTTSMATAGSTPPLPSRSSPPAERSPAPSPTSTPATRSPGRR